MAWYGLAGMSALREPARPDGAEEPRGNVAFGVAVIEAIACGLSTVTTAAGALRELADAPAVTQTKVDDVQQLAAALRAGMDGQLERDPDAQWRWVDENPLRHSARLRRSAADRACTLEAW